MLLSYSMTQRGRALRFLRSLNKVMFRRLLSLQLLSYYNSISKTFGAKQDSLARVCFCYAFAKMLPSKPSSWQIQFQYLRKSEIFIPPPTNIQHPWPGARAPGGPGRPGPIAGRGEGTAGCRPRTGRCHRAAMEQEPRAGSAGLLPHSREPRD